MRDQNALVLAHEFHETTAIGLDEGLEHHLRLRLFCQLLDQSLGLFGGLVADLARALMREVDRSPAGSRKFASEGQARRA